MSDRASVTLFAHLVSRPDAEIDLAEAALLIAEDAYPDLEVERYLERLDDLGRNAAAAVARAGAEPELRLQRVIRFVYEDANFHGNMRDYYDPHNSYLNDVLDRRTGIPITLAVVLIEICRHAGIEAGGVSFPGHFLVRSDTPRGVILVDPFSGHVLTGKELRNLYKRATGDDRDPPARVLEPATKVQILARMLNNLRAIHEKRGDAARLAAVTERLRVLAPGGAPRRSSGALS